MGTWTCTTCKEINEDPFDRCWKCGSHADGSPADIHEQRVDGPQWMQPPRLIDCQRCPGTRMQFIGRRRFHEGSQALPFLLGNLGELFVNREEFDLHACPNCGKVELFLSNH
ncbi:hypothetical protein [Stenotrophomonas sp.]|uniref:hypothetical protein n=1 Tax=Stenotrophomonas sp. TaxID=69392 RepID=UPI0028A7E5B7|nr:hypothetical protein [Stenotrophomonas sp.]